MLMPNESIFTAVFGVVVAVGVVGHAINFCIYYVAFVVGEVFTANAVGIDVVGRRIDARCATKDRACSAGIFTFAQTITYFTRVTCMILSGSRTCTTVGKTSSEINFAAVEIVIVTIAIIVFA